MLTSSTPSPPRPQILGRLLQRFPLGRLSVSVLFGLGLIFSTTLGFAWLAREVLRNEFAALDDALLLWLRDHESPRADAWMVVFTTLGGPLAITVLLVTTGLILIARRRWSEVGGVALAGLGCALLNTSLKHAFARERPALFESPFHLTSYSFPSGHAMGSLVGFGMVAFLLVRRARTVQGPVSPLLSAVTVLSTALLVLLIGLSRMYFGVHFPTDIVGGYLAGAQWLTLSILTVHSSEWWYARRSSR
ncbi:phosphatase PAP2 family protein [Chondromyces crocatus]|uniref:Phosphatidic acid phosphatase type 2/haloperoxidase domain-containing protein n=1 Tax=Chondromyces crocatus TaxID=52 RepID=A0A0K1E7T1_CHOCO|nr:phosphatase PAP2 family protein [Chondromyces crocatus]AKT36919.1 uncharacterized protein CMC5_010400 [Chondromyces crocatus]